MMNVLGIPDIQCYVKISNLADKADPVSLGIEISSVISLWKQLLVAYCLYMQVTWVGHVDMLQSSRLWVQFVSPLLLTKN